MSMCPLLKGKSWIKRLKWEFSWDTPLCPKVTEYIIVSRDVIVDEASHWNWNKGVISKDEIPE